MKRSQPLHFTTILMKYLPNFIIFIRKPWNVSNNLEHLIMLMKNQFQSQQKPRRHGGWILNFKLLKEYWEILKQQVYSNSQPKKRDEIKGYLNKWQDAGYVIHMAIFIDILSPLQRMSLSMQHENHDPIKIICCINEFTWAMSKLRLIVENSLDGNENQVKTCLQNFISNVKKNNDEYFYQDIKLHKYETTIAQARDIYSSAITNIFSFSIGFSNIQKYPIASWHISLAKRWFS